MAKQPMNPVGVQTKLTELYALTGTALYNEGDAIRSDFKLWLNNNFVLTAAQSTFISNIHDEFALHAGAVASTAIKGKLPINLTLPTPPSGYSSKFIILADNLHPAYNTVASYTVSGTVDFTIGYVV